MNGSLRPYGTLLRAAALLLAALVPLLGGCAQMAQRKPPAAPVAPAAPAPLAEEMELFRQARARFDAGEMARAEETYRWLSLIATDPAMRRASLYGLALSRLVQARDDKTLKVALDTWTEWATGRSAVAGPVEPGGVAEDPAMLAPVLPRVKAAVAPEAVRPVDSKRRKAGAQQQAADADARRELERTQEENRQLREKIEALEELQDELKVRQKGIVAP